MFDNPVQRARSVLISGASIAGPTLAYWLDRYGFDVPVVERASAVRSGGYPIDIRGTALDVVERMGLLPQVRAAHIESRAVTFVNADGGTLGVAIYDLTGNEAADVELPRGTLITLLYGLASDSAVRYRFGDTIEAPNDDGSGVAVRFASGAEARYDLVIGADGLHSSTRRRCSGPRRRSTAISVIPSTCSPCPTISAWRMARWSMPRRAGRPARSRSGKARNCSSFSFSRRTNRLSGRTRTERSRSSGPPPSSRRADGRCRA